MEQEKIKALLDRFFSGETSEEEEAQMREYLSDPAFSQLFPTEKEYFSLNSSVPEPSEDFFKNLEAVTRTEKKIYSRSPLLRYGLSVAAGAALLLGSYLLFDYMRPREWSDTYNDPVLAMAEVRNILTTVSANMKTGTGPLSSMKSMSIAPEAMKGLGRLNDAAGSSLVNLRYLNNLNTTSESNGNEK